MSECVLTDGCEYVILRFRLGQQIWTHTLGTAVILGPFIMALYMYIITHTLTHTLSVYEVHDVNKKA